MRDHLKVKNDYLWRSILRHNSFKSNLKSIGKSMIEVYITFIREKQYSYSTSQYQLQYSIQSTHNKD